MTPLGVPSCPGDQDMATRWPESGDGGQADDLWGSNIGFSGLTSRFTGARVRSCCDVVLAGKSVKDRSAVNLVIGQVDPVWGLGIGLCRCKLRQRSVWAALR